jgi:inner membrane protein
VIASNLPDLDLVYTGVTPEPLGYLHPHRGHPHPVAGLVAQAIVVAAVCLAPPLRRAIGAAGRGRFAVLVAASLAGHLVLDSWNVYGVHPFHPFDSRWTYGDAVFIFEPWLWLMLGIAAAGNARSRSGRVMIAVLLAVLGIALAAAGILPPPALAALAAAAALLAWTLRLGPPRRRAALALATSGVVVVGLFALSGMARRRAVAGLGADPGPRLLDVVVNPNPGWPACWAVMAIVKDARTDELVLRRGTVSLLPFQPPTACPSHRLDRLAESRADGRGLVWADERRQSIAGLRELGRRDCWTRAWLQFGRAPFVENGAVADLRFESGSRGNFTAMPVAAERSCPRAMTSWTPPRSDVLAGP